MITRVMEGREVVIASAGNRVKTSGSSIKHVELETLKYRIERVWSLPDRVRALHYARTLRDVCGCLRVGENRCSRTWSFAEFPNREPLLEYQSSFRCVFYVTYCTVNDST